MSDMSNHMSAARQAGYRVWSASPTTPSYAGILQGSHALEGAEAHSDGLRPLGGRPKRLLDICIASIALLLALPVMGIIALLIKTTTGGPVFFVHTRIGFAGKPFRCYKFQTMVPGAEMALARHLADDPQAAKEWLERRKLSRDPRISHLGRMLRVASMDELPQLLNILRGDMSCVGPRPVVAEELPKYGDAIGDYLGARPGLTGLWQVSGRDKVSYSHRVQLDSTYVREWSIKSDVIILIRTISVLIAFDQAS
jgi:exopolysaccharide production protein ExoY